MVVDVELTNPEIHKKYICMYTPFTYLTLVPLAKTSFLEMAKFQIIPPSSD